MYRLAQNQFFLRSIICCILLLSVGLSKAQSNVNIDSLRIAFDYSEDAIERVQIQIEIGDYYYRKRSMDTCIFEYRKAIGIVPPDSLDLKSKTLDRLAGAYDKTENLKGIIDTRLIEKDIYEKQGDLAKYARSISLIGRAYYGYAEYDSAMVYYMDAKKVYEKNNIVNDEYGYLLHFIGSVFKRQGNDDKACEYYNQEIEYGRKHGMKKIEAEGIYLSQICIDDPRESLNNYFKCKSIYTELGHDRMVALMYTLISGRYQEMEMLDSALYYQELCLSAYKSMGEISHLASAYSHISGILIEMKRYGEAEKYLEEALEVAARTGIKQHIRYKTIYQNYYVLSYEKGNYKDAVEYQSLMYTYRDSAMDQQHQDAIMEMEKIYNDEKQKAQLAILEKDNALAKQENQRAKEEAEYQSFIKKVFMIGGILVLLLGVFVFMKYRESQKQKLVISEQKREMEFQKELVEAKNKDIIDSMVYASSIQKAIITSEEYIDKMFREFFVFYRPRDIVSGDFYWAYETESGKKMIAVADCTGHGVPGAMMSMLGTAFLNEIVIEGNAENPSEVLNKLREQVKKSLNSDERRDGMDMCFCTIDNGKLTYSGANLPLYIMRKGELIQLKGDKQPIGYVPIGEQPFNETQIDIEQGDTLYMFSDGYADQFGGPKGKKYKYKTFRDKIADISTLPLLQQKKIIDEEFEIWKGDLEQLDDVCVLGIKI